MRGRKEEQLSVACLLNVEEMIPAKHPIRSIKTILNTVLREMDGQFEEMYGTTLDLRSALLGRRDVDRVVGLAEECEGEGGEVSDRPNEGGEVNFAHARKLGG
jgi:hypothetical protein